MEEDKPNTIEIEVNGEILNVTMEELLNLDVDIIDDPDVEYCPCGENFSDEDIATVLDAAFNGTWTKMTLEELIALHDSIAQNALKDDADLYYEEDIAKVIDAEANDNWVTRSPDEMIEHIQNLFKHTSGENNEIK